MSNTPPLRTIVDNEGRVLFDILYMILAQFKIVVIDLE